MATNTRTVDRTGRLGEDSILKLMIKYSLPSIVAMIVSSSYHLINMSFIGRAVGPLGIAAIAVCQPISLIQNAINQLVGNGCAAGVAIRLGQGDKEGSRQLLGSSSAVNIVVAAINIIIGRLFMTQFLVAFGASEAILPYARAYLSITLYGMLLSCFMTMNPILRIEGYPTRAMITMLLSTVVNLIFAPTFIFVFNMGIRGAALATLFAQTATGLWILLFLTNKKRTIRLQWKYFRIRVSHILYVMHLGLPNFLMSLTQSMLSVTMNNTLGTYGGDISISAWGITNSINSLVQQPVFGLNQGVQPIIGYNIGAGKHARVKEALLYSLVLATVFSSVGWIVTRLFPAQIFAFFNDDPELIAVGTQMLIVFRMFIFVVGVQQAGSAYFQYSGRPKTSALLTLSRQVLILIPCLLILPRFFLFDGILYSGPVSDLASTLVTVAFLFVEIRRLNKLIRKEKAAGEGMDVVTSASVEQYL
ncbi:MAG: MATE family efflux transporter [Clostridiales bacterium]|nr:MATE family efflux transporter [Clostridiales bacterium]